MTTMREITCYKDKFVVKREVEEPFDVCVGESYWLAVIRPQIGLFGVYMIRVTKLVNTKTKKELKVESEQLSTVSNWAVSPYDLYLIDKREEAVIALRASVQEVRDYWDRKLAEIV